MNQAIAKDAVPIEVRRQTKDGRGTGLKIRWSTGESVLLESKTIRLNCPCASCLTSRGDTSHQKPLGGGRSSLRVLKAGVDEETNLESVWPIGTYALGAKWGDGHDTGIFTYSLLLRLANDYGAPCEIED